MHNILELHGKESGQIWHRKGSSKNGYNKIYFNFQNNILLLF